MKYYRVQEVVALTKNRIGYGLICLFLGMCLFIQSAVMEDAIFVFIAGLMVGFGLLITWDGYKNEN